MSHDSNHGNTGENKTIISFKNAFWLVIIVVGLFIAALNFIQAETHGEGEEAKTEHGVKQESHEASHEATHEATEHKAETPAAETHEAATADTAAKAGH